MADSDEQRFVQPRADSLIEYEEVPVPDHVDDNNEQDSNRLADEPTMVVSGGAKYPTAESDISSADEPIVADERIPVINEGDDSDLQNDINNVGAEFENVASYDNSGVAEQDPHEFQAASDVQIEVSSLRVSIL